MGVLKLRCPYCKKTVEDNAKYCPYCGNKLGKENKNRFSKVIVGGIIILAAAGVGTALYKTCSVGTDSGIEAEEAISENNSGMNDAGDVENARISLFRNISESYQDETRPPAYAEIELTGDEIKEIIIRNYTSEATEGGRYIYNIYQYENSSKSFISPSDEIYSFAYEALLYDSDSKNLVVDWTYADEYSFVIYSYNDFKLSVVDEAEEDMSDLPALNFADLSMVVKIDEKKSAEKAADTHLEYNIDSFLGSYCLDVDDTILEEYDYANPEVMELYFNDEGCLERYSGLYYGTMGTTKFYPYDSYEIVGNMLLCKYSTVKTYYGEENEAGEDSYQLTENENLIQNEHVWFRRKDMDEISDSAENENKALQAQISVSGEIYKAVDLSENQTFTIDLDDGYNTISVKDGYVFVEEADCPRQTCVNQGKKNKKGSMIVCLPHKLLIQVMDKE